MKEYQRQRRAKMKELVIGSVNTHNALSKSNIMIEERLKKLETLPADISEFVELLDNKIDSLVSKIEAIEKRLKQL